MNKTMKADSEHAILEESKIAFDSTVQYSKGEKIRTTALVLAIEAYRELIIREAEYRRIEPATIKAITRAAMQFEDFITGQLRGNKATSETTMEGRTE